MIHPPPVNSQSDRASVNDIFWVRILESGGEDLLFILHDFFFFFILWQLFTLSQIVYQPPKAFDFIMSGGSKHLLVE